MVFLALLDDLFGVWAVGSGIVGFAFGFGPSPNLGFRISAENPKP